MSTLVSRKEKYETALDLYETPKSITEKLLGILDLKEGSRVLEPANGKGAISNVIKSWGYQCDTSDIVEGVDFLKVKENPIYDYVITNPPYKYAKEFVEKALTQVKEKGQVVMLLRLSFLEGKGRYHFFRDSGLKNVIISSGRITMYPFGQEEPKNKGTLAYAWYIWEKGYKGEPTISWFNYV